MKSKLFRHKLALALGIGLVAGVAILSGVMANAASTNVLAVGKIPQSKFFDGPAIVTVRTLTIKPGEVLAWHYHPGYAINVVKSGRLTVEEGCGGAEQTLISGDSFEEMDGHVHRAKNLDPTEDVVVYNTFIMPEGKGTTVNIPGNERRCGPPENIDECKNDGWLNFTHPQSFFSQGQCVDFVRHRPRNVIPIPEDPLN